MAPVWGWILAYLVGFLLFQAVIYWYLQGDGPSLEEPTPDYGEGEPAGRHSGIERGDPDADGVRCPHCGAYNERAGTIRYCRECVGEL